MARSSEEIQAEIGRNRNALVSAKLEIAQDATLSELGRRAKLQDAIDRAQAKHKALAAEYDAALEAEHVGLYRRAFGLGVSTLETYRGLYERAFAADRKGLEAMRGQAERTGDVALSKAVSQAAYDRGYTDLVDATPAIQDLYDFEMQRGMRPPAENLNDPHATEERSQRIAAKVARSALLSLPS